MSDVNSVLPEQKSNYEQNQETLESKKKHEDLFNGLKRSQNTDAASIVAAVVCLTGGAGSEET